MVKLKNFIKIIAFIFLFNLLTISTPHSSDNKTSITEDSYYLLEGKKSLENNDFDKAINLLTISIEKLPILADYALLWRAEAYEKKGDAQSAIDDLRRLREDYSNSPFIKNVRKKEVQLSLTNNILTASILLRKYINDYPDDMDMKFFYANWLKSQGEIKESKRIFKEIFLSTSGHSMAARKELSTEDITTRDLLKKGENLNKAYLFKESEKYFREALSRKDSLLRDEILKGLADSLFRQKRYTESAELYKKIKSHYWYARSLLRAGELKTFESELPALKKIQDPRMGNVLISYGNRKRRAGDIEGALKVYKETSSIYPSLKEESLWASAWAYYMKRDYGNAYNIFSQLHENFTDTKYAYWKARALEQLDSPVPQKINIRKDPNERDYYTILHILKNEGNIPYITNKPLKIHLSSSLPMQRVDILRRLGFKKETSQELVHLSRKNPDLSTLQQISLQLKELGNYKISISLLARGSYRSDLHELFYPLAYWSEIQEAARINNIDPYLVISVMREESRFDEEARSIAGAIGLMQLMPQTALRLNNELKLSDKNTLNLYNPKLNIMLGSYYLSKVLKEFKSIPAAIAAYNAGEHVVRDWLKSNNYKTAEEFIEDIPYDETRNYVKKVLLSYLQYQRTDINIDISATFKNIFF